MDSLWHQTPVRRIRQGCHGFPAPVVDFAPQYPTIGRPHLRCPTSTGAAAGSPAAFWFATRGVQANKRRDEPADSPFDPPRHSFPDFLRYMPQMRLNSDGELEPLKPDDWRALQERMRAVRRACGGQAVMFSLIPVGVDNQARRYPVVTFSLIRFYSTRRR